jgi:hypothetical protein
MGTRASVEMYLCAFHLRKWEPDESVEDAYHRALNITPDQFHDMRKDDDGAMQEKHANAIHRMYEVAGLNLKTATEAEKALLRLTVSRRGAEGWHEVSGLTRCLAVSLKVGARFAALDGTLRSLPAPLLLGCTALADHDLLAARPPQSNLTEGSL